MNRPITFGIIGGYGATGIVVASELRKSTDGEILIGGRQLEKAKALASQFDGRVSAAHVPRSMTSATAAGALYTGRSTVQYRRLAETRSGTFKMPGCSAGE